MGCDTVLVRDWISRIECTKGEGAEYAEKYCSVSEVIARCLYRTNYRIYHFLKLRTCSSSGGSEVDGVSTREEKRSARRLTVGTYQVARTLLRLIECFYLPRFSGDLICPYSLFPVFTVHCSSLPATEDQWRCLASVDYCSCSISGHGF